MIVLMMIMISVALTLLVCSIIAEKYSTASPSEGWISSVWRRGGGVGKEVVDVVVAGGASRYLLRADPEHSTSLLPG